MLNGRVQPQPISVILLTMEDEHNPRGLPGLEPIVESLADRLGPLVPEVEFDGVSGRDAVCPGAIRETDLRLAVMVCAPGGLVMALGEAGRQ